MAVGKETAAMLKWIRATFACGLILAAYWCYATLAVPWIEPSPSYALGGQSGPILEPPKPLIDTKALFPADAWQNGKLCKTIETSVAEILGQDEGA